MQRNFSMTFSPPVGSHLVAMVYGSGMDDYLATVLCYQPAADQWVTWLWNAERNSFGNGHYFRHPDDSHLAWSDFCNRSASLALHAREWHLAGILDEEQPCHRQ